MLGVLAFLVMVGLWYRLAIALFWLAFTYVALLDKTQYLNHFYLVSLLSFLLIFVPANRAWSLDAYFWPQIARPDAPAWTLWILRFQVAIPYIYGGLAKLNGDWLARPADAALDVADGGSPRLDCRRLASTGWPWCSATADWCSTWAWCRCFSGGGRELRVLLGRGVSRHECRDVSDRHFPLADDRRDDALL